MNRVVPFVLSALLVSGCHVSNRLYNPATKTTSHPGDRSVVAVDPGGKDHVDPACAPASRVCMAFVEFDEQGELWDKGQPDKAIELIRKAKRENPNTIVVSFVHGWKNNADDEPGRRNDNVVGFQAVLAFLKAQPKYAGFPIVGVFLSWRGDLVPEAWPVRRQLSYFDREGTAIRIPGASMTAVLTRIMIETHAGLPGAHLILTGHSFGGLVLERALTQAMTDYVLRHTGAYDGAQPDDKDGAWADLVVFVNSAASANEAKQMLNLLSDRKVFYQARSSQSRGADRAGRTPYRPLFLSISSLGDVATRFALPVGHGLSFLNFKIKGSWRDYELPDPTGVTWQSAYYLSTTAHMEALQSHVIVEGADDASARCKLDAANQPIYFGRPISTTTGHTYQICEKRDRWNETPYWAMQMPATIVPDHSGIFNANFVMLLNTFFLDGNEMADVTRRPVLQRRN